MAESGQKVPFSVKWAPVNFSISVKGMSLIAQRAKQTFTFFRLLARHSYKSSSYKVRKHQVASVRGGGELAVNDNVRTMA